jgi:homoserine acetyltransferase
MALAQGQCNPSIFRDLSLFGGKILHVETQIHLNYSVPVIDGQNHYAKNVTNLDACEVFVSYTHPGYNDKINAVVWLPSPETWTGRFMGAGGGGWTTEVEDNTTLPWAASEGFAVVSTDGGHAQFAGPEEWALISPGNLNWMLLQDFASTSLDDAATLGKQIVKSFYGKVASYSYWNGCSTGGRQGHMMAQRYPEQYDGILATAPAINWAQIMMGFYWPTAVMNDLGTHHSMMLKLFN